MQQIQFSKDQQQAIAAIREWYQGEEKYATLGGLAGTGKTTVVAHLLEEVFPEGTVVATPTGKAAQVLRSKGVHAATIHSVCYLYIGKTKKELLFEFEGVSCSLLVIDEASMIDRRVFEDLMRSGARILFVGDYGQLPPVGEDPGIMQDLTAKLELVHRQDNDILDFAHAVRVDEFWPFETPNVVRLKKSEPEAFAAMVAGDVVICGRNSTRHRTNLRLFFHEMGITDEKAQEDLRGLWFNRDQAAFFSGFVGRELSVICTKNKPQLDLWNGSRGRLMIEAADQFGVRGLWTGEDGHECDVDCSLLGWGTNPGDVDWSQEDPQVAMDLGYCITCHKSQGSEWDHVVVLDEAQRKERARWRYTAATRAKQRVTWIPART